MLLTVAAAALVGSAAFAADITEEQTTEKDIGRSEEKALKKVEAVKEGGRYKTKVLLAAMQGYDNNVFLDPRRKHDTFSEAILDASVIYPMNGRWDLVAGVNVHDITYWEATDANLIDTNLKLAFDGKMPFDINVSAYNNIDMMEYQNNDDGEYVGDHAGLTVKQKLPNNFFHTINYDFFYKNYSDRKALSGDGTPSDEDREDCRNTVYYDVGVHLKRSMFKVFGEYYYNKSNDHYMDYYDYDSVRLGSSFIYLFTKKLSTSLSYYRQFRNYSDRTVPDDNTLHEKDRTWVAGASVYYDIYKNTTLGLNYSYRQNLSNNPSMKYSGSIASMGLYMRF